MRTNPIYKWPHLILMMDPWKRQNLHWLPFQFLSSGCWDCFLSSTKSALVDILDQVSTSRWWEFSIKDRVRIGLSLSNFDQWMLSSKETKSALVVILNQVSISGCWNYFISKTESRLVNILDLAYFYLLSKYERLTYYFIYIL